MTTRGTIRLKKIWKMLRKCAKGFTRIESDHYWWIDYAENTFPSLPTGSHGRTNPEIERGVIKRMVNQLELDVECVHRQLPELRLGKRVKRLSES